MSDALAATLTKMKSAEAADLAAAAGTYREALRLLAANTALSQKHAGLLDKAMSLLGLTAADLQADTQVMIDHTAWAASLSDSAAKEQALEGEMAASVKREKELKEEIEKERQKWGRTNSLRLALGTEMRRQQQLQRDNPRVFGSGLIQPKKPAAAPAKPERPPYVDASQGYFALAQQGPIKGG